MTKKASRGKYEYIFSDKKEPVGVVIHAGPYFEAVLDLTTRKTYISSHADTEDALPMDLLTDLTSAVFMAEVLSEK